MNKSIIYTDNFSFNDYDFHLGVVDNKLLYLLTSDIIFDKSNYEIRIDNAVTRPFINNILNYLDNKINTLNINIYYNKTDFSNKVLEELMKIPYGSSLSYKEIAIKIGSPKSIRAVANVIAKNDLLLVIPCHRVIGSDLSLKGYRGGLELKKYLLDLENINYKL